MRKELLALTLTVIMAAWAGIAQAATAVDLTTFTADNGVTVSGGTATFNENELAALFLYKDNFFVPTASTISFDYSFHSDGIEVVDGVEVGDYLRFNIGGTDLFTANKTTANGHAVINLSDYSGFVDMDWGLMWGGIEFLPVGSSATISNVKLASPVPVPGALVLLASGLTALAGLKRKQS
jgi:hypothetical protein